MSAAKSSQPNSSLSAEDPNPENGQITSQGGKQGLINRITTNIRDNMNLIPAARRNRFMIELQHLESSIASTTDDSGVDIYLANLLKINEDLSKCIALMREYTTQRQERLAQLIYNHNDAHLTGSTEEGVGIHHMESESKISNASSSIKKVNFKTEK